MNTSLRVLGCMLLLAAAAFTAPQAASASKGQLSLIQDDRELFGESGADPAARMRELKALGVDVVRTNIAYYRIYRDSSQRRKPRDFNPRDPNSPHYNWFAIDRLIRLANENGIRVLATVTGPGPHFTSGRPNRCRSVPCSIYPKASGFGAFVQAVAKRYRGQIDYYSIWNEPNIATWIRPQTKRRGGRGLWKEGIIYRRLWKAGYKQIARHDRRRRNSVLFGEVAAIADPLPMLRTALCLNRSNRPLRGSARRRAGCGNFKRLNIAGMAIHPYNFGGFGSRGPRTKTNRRTALPIAYMPRLHRLTKAAVKRKRMRPRGRRVYITEYGYQTRPPDRNGVSPRNQARFINETDRLTYGDRLVRMVGQYELVDVREAREYNSGLRFAGGARKPAYDAYRMPIVVTRRSSRKVEIYGQVRPGGGRQLVRIQILRGGKWRTVRRKRTNGRGYIRTNVRLRRLRAPRQNWRLLTTHATTGEAIASRTARAGKRLRYRRR